MNVPKCFDWVQFRKESKSIYLIPRQLKGISIESTFGFHRESFPHWSSMFEKFCKGESVNPGCLQRIDTRASNEVFIVPFTSISDWFVGGPQSIASQSRKEIRNDIFSKRWLIERRKHARLSFLSKINKSYNNNIFSVYILRVFNNPLWFLISSHIL